MAAAELVAQTRAPRTANTTQYNSDPEYITAAAELAAQRRAPRTVNTTQYNNLNTSRLLLSL